MSYKKYIIIAIAIIIIIKILIPSNKNTLPLTKSTHDFDAIYLGYVSYMKTKPPSLTFFDEKDFKLLHDYIEPTILPGSGKGDPWEREYNYTILNDRGVESDKGRILIVWTQGFSRNSDIPVVYRMLSNQPDKIDSCSDKEEKMWALFYINSKQQVVYDRDNSNTRAVR